LVSHVARQRKEHSFAWGTIRAILGSFCILVFVKFELQLVWVSKLAVAVKGLVQTVKLPWEMTEIVSELAIIHFSDLIFIQLQIVELVIIHIQMVLSGNVLLIFFIRKLIMHPVRVLWSSRRNLYQMTMRHVVMMLLMILH
jgi:hypothetical protein